jgi:hypothetical protein
VDSVPLRIGMSWDEAIGSVERRVRAGLPFTGYAAPGGVEAKGRARTTPQAFPRRAGRSGDRHRLGLDSVRSIRRRLRAEARGAPDSLAPPERGAEPWIASCVGWGALREART